MEIINYSFAQDIVNYMMRIVPYSINIMNKKGIIIASGDHNRIGQLHEIALKAIKNNRIEIVETNGNGMMKGVNMPFYYHKELAGVVGISGNVEKTMEIILLVKFAIELLIEQETLLNNKMVTQQLKAQFLYEWLYLTTDHDTDFIERGKNLNIDVCKPRRVAIIQFTPDNKETQNLIKSYYDRDDNTDYYIQSTPTNYILVLGNLNTIPSQLNNIIDSVPGTIIGFGEQEKIINNSLMQAQAALRLGPIIYPKEHIFLFSSVEHLDAMLRGMSSSNYGKKSINNLCELLKDDNEYLLTTLFSYISNNGLMNVVADELHIHRNTLNYRISKLCEITGLNPRNYNDLFMLLCAYVQIKNG